MGARDVLADLAGAGLSVTVEGGELVIRPASKLTDALRAALREAKQAMLALLAEAQAANTHKAPELADVARTDQEIVRFPDLRSRLLRWLWAEPDAESLAERLVRRDRGQDDRVGGAECRYYQPGRCGNFRRAGLSAPAVGTDLAGLLQRCSGFVAVKHGAIPGNRTSRAVDPVSTIEPTGSNAPGTAGQHRAPHSR